MTGAGFESADRAVVIMEGTPHPPRWTPANSIRPTTGCAPPRPAPRVWREQWRLTAIGLFYALAYSALSLAIPMLVARAIDGSIVSDDRPLWPQLG